jgi:hypothetical protein
MSIKLFQEFDDVRAGLEQQLRENKQEWDEIKDRLEIKIADVKRAESAFKYVYENCLYKEDMVLDDTQWYFRIMYIFNAAFMALEKSKVWTPTKKRVIEKIKEWIQLIEK